MSWSKIISNLLRDQLTLKKNILKKNKESTYIFYKDINLEFTLNL
jgi:hypothetical protein